MYRQVQWRQQLQKRQRQQAAAAAEAAAGGGSSGGGGGSNVRVSRADPLVPRYNRAEFQFRARFFPQFSYSKWSKITPRGALEEYLTPFGVRYCLIFLYTFKMTTKRYSVVTCHKNDP